MNTDGNDAPVVVPRQRRAHEPNMVFSPARLRAWRHVRNVSHVRLADAVHVTVEHVTACERGTRQPAPATIAGWADALGCRPDQLCSTTPNEPGEYWRAANEAMDPMSTQDLAVIADVILRSRAHRATPDRPATS